MHVDGWLCEIKDVQIRDGLHVLGQTPEGDDLVNLVLAILRSNQVFGGQVNGVPGLRVALGLGLEVTDTERTDAARRTARAPGRGRRGRGLGGRRRRRRDHRACSASANPAVAASLEFACTEVVPRLRRTADEIDRGAARPRRRLHPRRAVRSPLRGLVNVLPTGRNFYSVDPKAIPSRLAHQTGQAMADSLLQRYLDETGAYPRSVGLSVWGTSAMRTSGDDIAEVLALLGVLPVWDEMSRRVVDLEVDPAGRAGPAPDRRDRTDLGLLPRRLPARGGDARRRRTAGGRAGRAATSTTTSGRHARADLAAHGDHRRATTRVFGSKPGSYGAGILPLIEAGNWRDDRTSPRSTPTWGGFAYGRDLDGVPARDDLQANYRRISVAAKNVDTREHDIADSDDYFQYHGGMIATVRALTGTAPEGVRRATPPPRTPSAPAR